MAEERSLVEILLRSRGAKEVYESSKLASAGIKDIGQAAVTTNKRTQLLHKGLLGLGAAGAGVGFLLYEGAKKSVEAYGEYESALAQVDRQLKNTHGSANITSDAIEQQAKSLSMLSGTSDKFAILGGESLLLTFTKVRNAAGKGNDIFTQATKGAVDMTSAFKAAGKSMSEQQAFTMLGKALQDPIKGSTMLRRVGVQLDDQQVKQIKTLMALGDQLGAQKVILDAVNERYKGAAKTAGDTLPGAFGKWHVATMNLKESVGHGLAPAVGGLADEMTRVAKGADPAFTKLGDDLNKIWGNKNLSVGDKFNQSVSTARLDLGPLADKFESGLKNAHLDQKLEHAVEWAAPKIADGMAKAAPKAASAFLHAFLDADAWGKLLIGGVLAKKLGAFGAAGRLFGKGGGGGVADAIFGRGASPLHPLFVLDVSSTTGKGWLSTAEKDAAKVAGGGAGAGALAKWGMRALKVGRFAGPAAVVADALINADSTSAENNPSVRAHNLASRREDEGYGNLGHAGGDPRGVFRMRGAVRMSHLHLTSNVTIPVMIDGRQVAETNARVRQHLKDRG